MDKLRNLIVLAHCIFLISASHQCDIECSALSKMPPRWTFTDEDVPMAALKCSIQSECSLDLTQLLNNYTRLEEMGPSTFLSVDVYLDCLVNGAALDFAKTQMANSSIIFALRLKNCKTSWEDISHVGELYSLLEVERILTATHHYVPGSVSKTLNGLADVAYLTLHLLNYTGRVNIEDLLPYQNMSMTNVGGLVIECLSLIYGSVKNYCEFGVATYQPSQLSTLFPHLQTLTFSGVYPKNNKTKLGFPWDQSSVKLPMNLSNSRFQREFMTARIPQKANGLFPRTLGIVSNPGLNITNFCPFQRSLDTIIFGRTALQRIPHNCFTPQENDSSTLQIIDLTNNWVGKFESGTFDRLCNLEVLHASSCILTELQVGLFDDLVNLRLLDLDYNRLTVLNSGLFSKLVSLEQLYIHQNHIYHVDQQTLPIYSPNFTLVDFRWNRLQTLPTDCSALPNACACDCRNNSISLNNLTEIIDNFDPIKMAMAQPLAYYGESYSRALVGEMHQTAQSVISLGGNKVTGIDFNNTWPIEKKKQLASFLSFFQITLDSAMDCDCRLYHFRQFINTREAYNLVKEDVYPHVLPLSTNNFDTWKCSDNPILHQTASTEIILGMPTENFICVNASLTCPKKCLCYSGAYDPDIVVDCTNRNLTELPKHMPKPVRGGQLIVSLEYNRIVSLVPCYESGYEWLQQVTKLNIQHNELTPKKSVETDNFLRCLNKTTHLYLAYNNIKQLPISIQHRKYKEFSISGNKLQCDCTSEWMKEWLQSNNDTIQKALTMHCQDKQYPIVQLEKTDFVCYGIVLYLGVTSFLSALVIITIIVSIAIYTYEFEIKVLLFEKFNWHPFDKQDEDEGKEHDVYLMYCRQDEVWVKNTLLAGLENFGYRTCVPDRDFTIGASTAAEMAEAFSKTHRVLVAISQHFVDNTSAMSDFFHAYSHDRSAAQKRFLVLIQLRDNIQFGERHEIFRRYISTNYFVPIRSTSFWSRLTYWLPPIKQKELPASTDNIEFDTDEFSDEQDEGLTSDHVELLASRPV